MSYLKNKLEYATMVFYGPQCLKYLVSGHLQKKKKSFLVSGGKTDGD